jgi:hypothetical protein
MADSLVKLLNKSGYQPVFLPQSGIIPPDLYNFADHRLIRRGALVNYIPEIASLSLSKRSMADIEGKQTSAKNFNAAVDFLSSALSVLGISSIPKIDLSFTGARQLSFAFTDILVQALDPAVIDQLLPKLKTPPAIPEPYVTEGALHIAYEYLYSSKLLMSRSDGGAFAVDVKGDIGSYINLGGKGKVEWKSENTISFSGASSEPAAFAYKAGRLQRIGSAWTFEPEVIAKGIAKDVAPESYLPARGVVLKAENEEG